MKNILVIGGGAAGLAAAIHLAEAGCCVTVLEASRAVGGRARTDTVEGFAFNFGPHALYRRAERLLVELGVEVSGGVPGKGLTMQVGDRLAALPAGPGSLLANGALGWADKWRFGKLLGGIGRLDAEALDATSVATWLDREGLQGVVRDVALASVRIATYTNAPERLSAGAAIRQLRAAVDGVLYVHGGWGAIVDGLVRRACALGVTLRTDARATSLDVQGDRVTGLVLRDGERLACDGVVGTLSPKATVSLLGAHAPEGLRAFAEQSVAVRAACLDVALRRLPRRHPSLILGTNEPVYVSIHSNTAHVAPEGGGLVHAAKYLAPGERVTPHVRAELEAYLDMSQPGWRDTLVEARWAPAATVTWALPDAATGGLAGRPRTDAAGLRGVALAGDWVGPDGMLLDASLFSARAAAWSLGARAAAA